MRRSAALDTEAARLAAERKSLDELVPTIEAERQELERAVESLNARVTAARAAGQGGPSPEEIAAINAQRDAYNSRAAAMNRRGLEFRVAQDEYNLQAARYNLMATYPDGLDEPRGKS